MNARNQAAFLNAMRSICAEPTLADVQRWGVPLAKYPHFLWAIEATWAFKPTAPVHQVKAFLAGRVAYLESIAADRPEKLGLLIPTKQMLRHIEAFEQRNARAA